MSLLEKLNKLPPCLMRVAARDPKGNGRRLSLVELAQRAGLSYGAVARLSRKKSWATVPVWIIDRYAAACGVDILHPKYKIRYLERALHSPNGYRNLAADRGRRGGRGSPRHVLRMLQGLADE